jgi:hypothetical protein
MANGPQIRQLKFGAPEAVYRKHGEYPGLIRFGKSTNLITAHMDNICDCCDIGHFREINEDFQRARGQASTS